MNRCTTQGSSGTLDASLSHFLPEEEVLQETLDCPPPGAHKLSSNRAYNDRNCCPKQSLTKEFASVSHVMDVGPKRLLSIREYPTSLLCSWCMAMPEILILTRLSRAADCGMERRESACII